MAIQARPLPDEGIAAKKLSQLRASIVGADASAPETNGKSTHAHHSGLAQQSISAEDPSALAAIAEGLFARAPEDYLHRADLVGMRETASDVASFFRRFQESSAQYLVEVKEGSSSVDQKPVTILMTAIGDRPFIIDTLTELLRRRGLHLYVYLHPIFIDAKQQAISLVYIELERLALETDRRELNDLVSETFEQLVLVTEDFSSMVARAETAAERIAETRDAYNPAQREEVVQFLRWLMDGGFVFLGFREWSHTADQGASQVVTHVAEKDLGLFRSTIPETVNQLAEVERDAVYLAGQSLPIHFSKIRMRSPVHRTARIDVFTLKAGGADAPPSIYCFIGLLTSKSIAQEASTVPFIRQKLKNVLELEGLKPNSHNYKEIISIADSMPKADLLQYSIDRLRQELFLVFDLQRRSETRVSAFLDPLKRFVSLIVVIPRERYSDDVREKIQYFVEDQLAAEEESAEVHLSLTDYPLVVLRLLVPSPSTDEVRIDIRKLEREITVLTLTWDDSLQHQLAAREGESRAIELRERYAPAFPEHYKASISPEQAVIDIGMLESLSETELLDVSIERSTAPDTSYRLRLYKAGAHFTLSAIIPYLENVGFEVLTESMTPIVFGKSSSGAIYDLLVRPLDGMDIDPEIAASVLIPGLKLVLLNKVDNDQLNRLLLRPGLSCTQIAVLRLLTRYLWQIKAGTSEHAIVEAIVRNPSLALLLVQFFSVKFDPDQFPAERFTDRFAALERIKSDIHGALKNVQHLSEDRALRSLLNVIEAAVRTNFFQERGDPFRIALKIECARITKMPAPRPMFEIFVNGPEFDGVHLRGGKVARGGLRWSDRKEDFRTEVLGLMKTQMVKNSIIVPVGAKGGFVIKHEPKERDELLRWVKHCYQGFIRSLLEITDNRKDGEIAPPPRTVRYDDDDPYLVVAADRGTATFSDTANAIANEFQFWLGDAFASGGSAGYDHKKYGITARGAWEAVCRHFREIGIDVDNQEFTVTGIGDMSGDVFGNGLLLSKNARLIAAFNHRHIFIDPTPDAKASFIERQRLFHLPHSAWSDYDSSLISEGGAVYERRQKEITLSPQARQALGTAETVVSGEELIRIILKAPADLLWNGGIGTYVKAHVEDHGQVGDRANDDVRVDARELRVRVIGEGGNLGMTQLARIEYSRIGGHCNVDAVDNSGGVDMSDLEVNLKILLRAPVQRGELSVEERNQLMLACAEEACQKVVSRNRSQSMVLSLAVRRSRKNIGYYHGLISALEQEGLLDRGKEFLPDDETLEKRSSLKAGLTRPELAILIAYCKMSLYNTIIQSSLPEEPYLHRYLTNYFPRSIAERFSSDIANHPLRREIIATQVANLLVERMGASFAYRSAEETGAPKTDIIRSFLAADAIIDAEHLSKELRVMDKANATRSHLITLLRIQSAIDGMTRWFLEHSNSHLALSELIDSYRGPFRTLVGATESLITDAERSRFQEACRQLIVNGVPRPLATAVAASSYATAYLDIVEISNSTATDVVQVAHLYSHLAVALQIRQLLEQANDIEAADRWESLAIRTVAVDIRQSIAALTTQVVEHSGAATKEAMAAYLGERKEIIERYRHNVQQFHNRSMTVPALLVISNQLSALSRSR